MNFRFAVCAAFIYALSCGHLYALPVCTANSDCSSISGSFCVIDPVNPDDNLCDSCSDHTLGAYPEAAYDLGNGPYSGCSKSCKTVDPAQYDDGNMYDHGSLTSGTSPPNDNCSCTKPTPKSCTPSCSPGYTGISGSGKQTRTHCVNDTYGSCEGGTCTPNQYTVTLNPSSGSGGSTSVTASFNNPMPSATMPTRTAYDFDGYYAQTNGGGTKYYNSDGSSANAWNIADSATLFAKWTPTPYTITLNIDGGSCNNTSTANYGCISGVVPPATSYTIESSEITISAPTKADHLFGGWCENNQKTSNCTTTKTISTGSTGPVEYWAKWIECLDGQYNDGGVIKTCEKGYYCENCARHPCPAATTTQCSSSSSSHFFGNSCPAAPNEHTGAKDIKACALVGGSKICDSGTPPVCYEFKDPTPGSPIAIHWASGPPSP